MSVPYPLRGLVESWHAKDFYAEAGLRRRGAGLLYLLVVVAIVQALLVSRLAVDIHSWLVHDAPAYANQVPEMTIEHGRLWTNAPMPHAIVDPKTGQVFALIDPEANAASLPPGSPPLVLTRTQLVLRRSAVETRIIELSTIRHFELGPAQVMRGLRWVALFLPPLAYLGFVIGAWIWNEVVALALALFGLLLARRKVPGLGYAACLRIAVVALTPVMVLDAFLHLGHVKVPLWGLISLLIGLAYVVLGVTAAQGEADASPAEALAAPADPPPPVDPGAAAPS